MPGTSHARSWAAMVRSRQSRIKNYFAENRLFTIRSIVAGVFAAVLLVAVAGRLFYLQVIKFDYYKSLSQGNSIRTEPIPPSRGLILDRHGVVLADNMPAFNIELVREQVGDAKAVDATLAQLVSIGLLRSDEVSNIRRTILLHKVYESVPIKLSLNEEEMARFAVHRYQFAGVDIRARLARHYPLREMGVHAIGYVSAINEQDLKQIDSAEYAGTSLIGKLGVEGAYEQQLHGKPGFKEIEVNAAGRPVDKQGGYAAELHTRPPVAGEDLILGMDVRVQKVAEEALAGKRGSVVALDPKTGDIIALASTPGFDPNDFVRGLSVAQYAALSNNIDVPLLNRALRGAYPPGSTVKPLYALAAQNYGITDAAAYRILPGFLYLARQQQQVPRRRSSWLSGYAAAPSPILRRVFLPGRRENGHRSHARVHECIRLWRIDRDRYSGRKARPICLARMEAQGLQAQGRSSVVSRRNHQHGHRPRSHHGYTSATGALRRRNCRARQNHRDASAGRGDSRARFGDRSPARPQLHANRSILVRKISGM